MGAETQKAGTIQDPRLGQTCWFILPENRGISSGRIVALREVRYRESVLISYDGGCGKVAAVPQDEIFASRQDVFSVFYQRRSVQVQAYLDEMPDLESCLLFPLDHPVAKGPNVDAAAREAFFLKAKAFFGDISFSLGFMVSESPVQASDLTVYPVSDTHSMEVNDPCWFFRNDDLDIESGTIKALHKGKGESGTACVSYGFDGALASVVSLDKLFVSEDDARVCQQQNRERMRRLYTGMMPDLRSCILFAASYPVAHGSKINWTARETYIRRVQELTGNDSFARFYTRLIYSKI